MKPKHKRLGVFVLAAVAVALGASLIVYSFRSQLIYFYTPTQLLVQNVAAGQVFRLGGLVKVGSVELLDNQTTRFIATDLTNDVRVSYTGVLPNLFREGQGMVADGSVTDGVFIATRILAKHDENYMPPEVAKALKESGEWKEYSPQQIEAYQP